MGIESWRRGTERTTGRNSGGREAKVRLPVRMRSGKRGTEMTTGRNSSGRDILPVGIGSGREEPELPVGEDRE